jgi:hypothetical protein
MSFRAEGEESHGRWEGAVIPRSEGTPALRSASDEGGIWRPNPGGGQRTTDSRSLPSSPGARGEPSGPVRAASSGQALTLGMTTPLSGRLRSLGPSPSE